MFQRVFKKTAHPSRSSTFSVAENERVYAVGDIHGRDDLLGALLARIEKDCTRFEDDKRLRVIFLGDYIDRGDHSREVLDQLCEAQEQATEVCEFLMGNHEAALLDFLADPIANGAWLEWGGRQTLVSYGLSAISRKPDREERVQVRDILRERVAPHLSFLQSLERYAVSGNVVFAHAGVDPTLALDDQPDAALLWGQIPSGQPSGLPGFRIVHGHYANWEHVSTAERICVDTGAYYSGRLTAVRLDTEEHFLHVDAADLLP